MAFHNLLLVRDEADLIEECLSHLLTWCDAVHIYDTGSTDGTWDIIQELARRDRRINPVAREEVFYSDSLRAMVFDRVRHAFRGGDWIARLDADEFAHAHPPTWITANLSRIESRIRALFFEFVIRRSDVEAEAGDIPASARLPIDTRRRWYYMDPHPEYRLFRYRRFMRWPHDRAIPLSCGLTAYERLPIRHYRCRDVEQVKRRCAVRATLARHAAEATGASHSHWTRDWTYWVWPDADPRLRHWHDGAELPVPRSARAARGTRAHLLRQFYYGSGAAGLADVFRSGFDRSYQPVLLPAELQARLRAGQAAPPSQREPRAK